MSGLDAIRAIRAEDATARIIVLTMYQGDEDIHRALQAGAAAYVLKSTCRTIWCGPCAKCMRAAVDLGRTSRRSSPPARPSRD